MTSDGVDSGTSGAVCGAIASLSSLEVSVSGEAGAIFGVGAAVSASLLAWTTVGCESVASDGLELGTCGANGGMGASLSCVEVSVSGEAGAIFGVDVEVSVSLWGWTTFGIESVTSGAGDSETPETDCEVLT